MGQEIAERYQNVVAKIEAAKQRRTTVPKDAAVTLVAVTKNHDVAAMREAIAAGATNVGENRVQEAKGKFAEIGNSVTWHLIGHLQTNKVRQAVKFSDLIHSVDSLHLAEAISSEAARIDKVQDILVQVNLAKEDSKSGVYREDLQEVLQAVTKLPNLRLRGLMCMAPNYDDVEKCRPLFREMYKIYQQIKEMGLPASNIDMLSMGMTHDYEIAVEEGANVVRVGTAIFGPRQY
ncbi:MAG: YggS family pyridoxal phosphate-dependent enzyme [Selenomonas ruminantium]|uniref:Pyridoxal phosphate homeostasis protein n=1 Tax=Selenomonas ruminantium TaxID=971 RepID=A0A927WFZ7_SELRU|nr:YggS family pyridoxal phosphate-dependent enzyme [Selenomonas ruminantium]MBE6086033.1 YggS family pyridoxal phosphate-dependent enzyme [Selenomonas ruminantium]